jgi:RepB DNA-primase N-terminal domain
VVQTSELARKQIEAMKSDVFELGLFRLPSAPEERDAEMLPRAWDTETLLRSIAWLRFENMRGRNIYIRPQGEHNLSLVDDLSKSAIERMKAEGFEPAAIIETSPRNFQAWLNHGERLPKDIGTAAAQALAIRFQGDTKAADWRHFGRLAGFTNQKEKYRQSNGLFPFVRLIESNGVAYTEAGRLVADIREQCEREHHARRKGHSTHPSPVRFNGVQKSIETFRQNPAYGGDGTRIDLAYALYALSRGTGEEEAKAAIRTRDLSHKGSERRQEEYIERTIRKALALQQSQSRSR